MGLFCVNWSYIHIIVATSLLQIMTESQMGVLGVWCWKVGCVCVSFHFLFKPYHVPGGVSE